ncbi:unnamed protein product [Oikopleura dioica]|uniref:Uncharacterized protein n=1 Tax=Oikopleura dioica TaxID=34765 RepID=E4XYI6_OIKDI|nr:unnamed protein product [Oikopleura dioica]
MLFILSLLPAGFSTGNRLLKQRKSALRFPIGTQLLVGLFELDSWGLGASPEELKKTVPLSFSQVDVEGASVIRGEYTFGPSKIAALAAKPTINNIGLEIATPLSYKVTCDYASSIAVKISEVGIDANPTFGSGSSTTGSLDIGATLTGADDSSNKWTIGDTVTLTVADNTADSLTVSVAIESCTAYSDKDYKENAVPISQGTCYENQINTQLVTKDYLHVSALSWDQGSGGAAAYVQCQLRACIVKDGSPDAACTAAVSENNIAARDADVLTCLK